MPLPLVERLPWELLEIIFLKALEVNFARASLQIAAAVSRERVFGIFLIHAFWNPRPKRRDDSTSSTLQSPHMWWHIHESEAFTKRHPCAIYRILPPEYQKRLQTHVMSCRWFNSRRLRVVQHTMLEMTLESVDSSIVRWEPYSYARQPPTPREDSIPPPRLVQDTETGLIRRIRVLDNFSYLVECPQSTQSFQTCIMAGFPDKALCGPWTTDKVDLLFNLWWNLDRKFKGTHFRFYEPVPSGYMIPEVRPQAYEEGIKKALINGNAAVIICLLDIRRCALLQSNETRKHARLPDEIFALALYYCTRRRDILQMLVQADLEWQWAHPEQTNSASLPKTDSTATARDLTQAHLKELAYDVTRPRPSYDVPWPGVG